MSLTTRRLIPYWIHNCPEVWSVVVLCSQIHPKSEGKFDNLFTQTVGYFSISNLTPLTLLHKDLSSSPSCPPSRHTSQVAIGEFWCVVRKGVQGGPIRSCEWCLCLQSDTSSGDEKRISASERAGQWEYVSWELMWNRDGIVCVHVMSTRCSLQKSEVTQTELLCVLRRPIALKKHPRVRQMCCRFYIEYNNFKTATSKTVGNAQAATMKN